VLDEECRHGMDDAGAIGARQSEDVARGHDDVEMGSLEVTVLNPRGKPRSREAS
jgi:hypothetical protein